MAELTEEEKAILAYTLLGEAAGEGRKGMEAVMHVIQNRSESGRYPASPRDVALQKSKGGTYQFTTWSPRHGNDPIGTYSKSSKSYQTALEVVNDISSRASTGRRVDPTNGALHYFASSGASGIKTPKWFRGEATAGTVKIGNHLFASKAMPDVARNNRIGQEDLAARLPTLDIDYLPKKKEELQQVVRSKIAAGALPSNTIRVTGEGLAVRGVQTKDIRIDPATGRVISGGGVQQKAPVQGLMKVVPGRDWAASAPSKAVKGAMAAASLPPTQAWGKSSGGVQRVNTVIVRKDGTVVPVGPSQTPMPKGARPSSVPAPAGAKWSLSIARDLPDPTEGLEADIKGRARAAWNAGTKAEVRKELAAPPELQFPMVAPPKTVVLKKDVPLPRVDPRQQLQFEAAQVRRQQMIQDLVLQRRQTQNQFYSNGVANPAYRDYNYNYTSEGGGLMPANSYGGNGGGGYVDSLGGTYYDRHTGGR